MLVRLKGCEFNLKGCDFNLKGCDFNLKGCDFNLKGCDFNQKRKSFLFFLQVLGPDCLVYTLCALLPHLRRRIVPRASCRDLVDESTYSVDESTC